MATYPSQVRGGVIQEVNASSLNDLTGGDSWGFLDSILFFVIWVPPFS